MSDSIVTISGVVTDLMIHAGEEEFFRGSGDQTVGIAAAAGLAAAGLAGVAAGASLAAASAGDSVEFFTCKVGTTAVQGRFSKASFREGDEVLAAVIGGAGKPLTVAMMRKADSTLWMVPHCSRGIHAHRQYSRCILVWIFAAIAGLLSVVTGIFQWSSEESLNLNFTLFWLALALGNALIAALYYSIRFYRQWLPIVRQAEQIFAALGYSHPSRVDLERDHKLYCIVHGIKWPYSSDGPWIYRYLDESITGK